MNGIGSHTKAYRGAADEWLTPPEILSSLGDFDLDPCSPVSRPWDTAKQHYTVNDDGLILPWHGRVWCNPPYGPETIKWMHKLATHGNGIALIFARTETKMFFETVWKRATAVLFIEGRLTFHKIDGSKGHANSGGPSVLVAYGNRNAEALSNSDIQGHLVLLNYLPRS